MGQTDTERELKMLLTEKQYEELKKAIPADEIRIQKNTYFDTPDGTLRKNLTALRIRKLEEGLIMTIKKPKDEITKFEYERPVTETDPNKLNDEDRKWMTDHLGFDPDHLSVSASFTTERRITNLKHAELALDRTEFRNHTDYEIEYEYRADHNGIAEFNSLLEPFGLHYEKNCRSKIARAADDLVQ